ncbi:MAG TPA: calcium/sodium antiporter [Longimicrobiales bacterium]|nr:calcium/sodium antiporter [Longimicrobiales bacterium]
MLLWPVVQIVLGIGLLTLGADLLVHGAAALAERIGLSPLVIGLTVVAFGTSMPEVSVSIGSVLTGEGGVALGNALGSNIFNILVVLGGSAIIRPLLVDRQIVRLDVPVMIGTAVLVFLLSLNGVLGRGEGICLLLLGGVYTVLLVRAGLKAGAEDGLAPSAPPAEARRAGSNLVRLSLGLVLLVVGARVLVDGSETAARALGVSELVIGLTVVAAGTSLPELATSFVAAMRGQRDIAVGNVVGSNIFNSLIVLGAAGVASGSEGVVVPLGVLTFDLPVMLAASVACLPIFFTGWTISRWEGWVFVGYYGVYLLYLVLSHTQHGAEDLVRAGLYFFAVPLTALTLSVLAARELTRRRNDTS